MMTESKAIKNNKLITKETRLDNRLSEMGLRGLNKVELNLWWAIVKLIKDKGTDRLIFSRGEIESISGYSNLKRTKKTFMTDMRNMGSKLVSINTNLYDYERDRWIVFSLFPVFEVSPEEVEIQVSSYFYSWFNDIQNNFTRIDLSVLIGLNSSYSKELYRFLMRWKNLKKNNIYPGFWSVDIAQFRRLMCIPENYNMSDIKRRILNPAYEELTSINFDGWAPLEKLSINYVLDKGKKKKVKKIEFSFKQGYPIVSTINLARENTQELLPLGIPEKPYENNFKNDYIPGKNSPTKVFKAWLAEINLFKDNDEYFEMRGKSKTDLISIYKSKVIDTENKYWTDMRFFAAVYSVITKNKAMTSWNIEDAYADIREGKTLQIPKEVYNSLPTEKGTQLQEFALKGRLI